MKIRAHWILGPLAVLGAAILGLNARTPEASQQPATRVASKPAAPLASNLKAESRMEDQRSTHRDEVTPQVPTAADSSEPSFHPYPVHPRDPSEWQGRMQELIDEPCNDDGYCGRSRACRADRTCGPCLSDADCLKGEVCVLDHCLQQANIECRSRRDCSEERLCVLENGPDIGPRGNEGVWSVCDDSEKHKQLLALGTASEVPALDAKELEQFGPPIDVESLFSYLGSGDPGSTD